MVVQSLVTAAFSTADSLAVKFDSWLNALLRQLAASNQRRLISCEGNLEWCRHLYETCLRKKSELVLLSNYNGFEEAVQFSKVETLLGSESELVVVDLFEGLNTDVICIASGLVKSGGLLVLLSPGPQKWSETGDRYGIWQNQQVSPQFGFVQYFFESMDQDACIRIQQGCKLAEPATLPLLNPAEFYNGRTYEQADVLEEIDQWLTDTSKSIALLTADRGRGKSACLGFAIREMMEKYGYAVLLSAYSRRSADTVFKHCKTVSFVAPDQAIECRMSADILVIDEAAMLPCSMLLQLCSQFKKVFMATTTGGYEGTGQGFLLRFVARLNQNRILRLNLHRPVRWAENDCLETWINKTFLMNSVLPEAAEISGKPPALEYQQVDGRDDIDLIKKIYRLMTSAHYRTRPSDLRALIENPDLNLIIAKFHSHVTGMLATNFEGGFDQALSEEVFFGRRRPKGHLLAQMLTAQAGLRHFACYSGARIQRIAVDQCNRRKGIGRRLIEYCEADIKNRRLDYIGACFALDSDSAAFWSACGFRLVHISHGRGKSTGNHTVVVIKVLNDGLDAALTQLQDRLKAALPVMMVQNLRYTAVVDVIAMLRLLDYKADLNELEFDEVEAFAGGNRGLDLCFSSLQRFVMQQISRSTPGRNFDPWLIERLVQNRHGNELTPQIDCVGKKSIEKKLRRLVAELIA